jgi:hypothetical protein
MSKKPIRLEIKEGLEGRFVVATFASGEVVRTPLQPKKKGYAAAFAHIQR